MAATVEHAPQLDPDKAEEIQQFLPNSIKNLRACLRCRIVMTKDQFFRLGCPKCEDVLHMRENENRVTSCTTKSYRGFVSVIRPGGFVTRFNGLDRVQPACYALTVQGEIPARILNESDYEQEQQQMEELQAKVSANLKELEEREDLRAAAPSRPRLVSESSAPKVDSAAPPSTASSLRKSQAPKPPKPAKPAKPAKRAPTATPAESEAESSAAESDIDPALRAALDFSASPAPPTPGSPGPPASPAPGTPGKKRSLPASPAPPASPLEEAEKKPRLEGNPPQPEEADATALGSEMMQELDEELEQLLAA